jgi:hypothetical protein
VCVCVCVFPEYSDSSGRAGSQCRPSGKPATSVVPYAGRNRSIFIPGEIAASLQVGGGRKVLRWLVKRLCVSGDAIGAVAEQQKARGVWPQLLRHEGSREASQVRRHFAGQACEDVAHVARDRFFASVPRVRCLCPEKPRRRENPEVQGDRLRASVLRAGDVVVARAVDRSCVAKVSCILCTSWSCRLD